MPMDAKLKDSSNFSSAALMSLALEKVPGALLLLQSKSSLLPSSFFRWNCS